MGGADDHEAAIGAQVVDAVGDGDGVGLGAEVVIVDGLWRSVPRWCLGFLKLPISSRFLVSMLTIGRPRWANFMRAARRYTETAGRGLGRSLPRRACG